MNSAKLPTNEADLVGIIASHVRREFGRTAAFALEVRSHGRARTDIVITVGEEIVAIEAKLTQWRRALGQAILNRYCVDRSYVAMWRSAIHADLLEEARSYGLGVIAVESRRMEVVLRAELSAPDRLVRSRIAASIKTK